jgi:DNA polymerase-3 subunit alpha
MYAQRYATSQEAQGQEGLFDNSGNSKVVSQDYIIQEYEEFPETEKYNREKAAIGFYITGHPLANYEKDLESFVDLTFGEDPAELDFNRLKTVTMCGVINDSQVKISKKGNKFVVFNLVDFYGSGECVAFGKLYEMKANLFNNDTLVVVRGIPEENGDKIKLIVNEIYSIDTFLEIFTKNLTIHLSEKDTEVSNLYLIKNAVENNIGTSNLFFNVMNTSHSKAFISKEYKIKATKELISNLKNIIGENNLKLN